MDVSGWVITRICDICHNDLKEDEMSGNAFPYCEGTCCEKCDIDIVLTTRKLCLLKGLYYVTDRRACSAYVRHLKATGVLPVYLNTNEAK